MSKYINADDLRNAMYHEAFETDTKMQKWESGCWIRYKLFENVLNAMPSVDVVEVKHGEWIKNDNETYSCSICNSWIPNEQHYYARYCLHCGAEMRGKDND